MKRIDAPFHVNNRFSPGNPAEGVRGTRLDSTWANAVQEELANIVESTGLSLDDDDDSQVLQAIQTITDDVFEPLPPATLDALTTLFKIELADGSKAKATPQDIAAVVANVGFDRSKPKVHPTDAPVINLTDADLGRFHIFKPDEDLEQEVTLPSGATNENGFFAYSVPYDARGSIKWGYSTTDASARLEDFGDGGAKSWCRESGVIVSDGNKWMRESNSPNLAKLEALLSTGDVDLSAIPGNSHSLKFVTTNLENTFRNAGRFLLTSDGTPTNGRRAESAWYLECYFDWTTPPTFLHAVETTTDGNNEVINRWFLDVDQKYLRAQNRFASSGAAPLNIQLSWSGGADLVLKNDATFRCKFEMEERAV